jgi:phenylalanyl-tRNA synthetase beta subunit
MPVVERDLALVMKKAQAVGDVQKELQKLLGTLALDVGVLDLYEGSQLEVGQKSVTYRIRLQDPLATLQDDVVQALMTKAITGLQTKFGVQVR